jgi:hypothetical protein
MADNRMSESKRSHPEALLRVTVYMTNNGELTALALVADNEVARFQMPNENIDGRDRRGDVCDLAARAYDAGAAFVRSHPQYDASKAERPPVAEDLVARVARIQAFLFGEFARRESFQCTRVELFFAPGGNFCDELLRAWTREDALFDNAETLAATILEIAETEAAARWRLRQVGMCRFIVRTSQFLGGRATLSFSLHPAYRELDEKGVRT